MSEGNGHVKGRDALLAMCGRRYVEVEGFRLQSLSEGQQSAYEATVGAVKGNPKKYRAAMESGKRRLLVLMLVDANGKRLFEDGEEGVLKALDGALTHRLFSAATDHVGYDDEDIEELVKNSEETTADASPSG